MSPTSKQCNHQIIYQCVLLLKNIYLAILAVEDYLLNPAEFSSDWLVQEDSPEFLCVLRLHYSVGSQGCQLPVEGF